MNMGLVSVMVVDEDRLGGKGTHQKHGYYGACYQPTPKARDAPKRHISIPLPHRIFQATLPGAHSNGATILTLVRLVK